MDPLAHSAVQAGRKDEEQQQSRRSQRDTAQDCSDPCQWEPKDAGVGENRHASGQEGSQWCNEHQHGCMSQDRQLTRRERPGGEQEHPHHAGTNKSQKENQPGKELLADTRALPTSIT